MKAVVFAGGHASPELAQAAGTSRKALMEVGGRPSLWHVLSALSGSTVEGVAVVGAAETEGIAEEFGAEFHPEGAGAIDNILIGMRALGADRALVIPGDLPLLRAEDVDRFLAMCPDGAGVGASFVRREAIEREQPGAPYTGFIRVREGRFAAGNVSLLRLSTAERMAPRLRELHDSRKSRLRTALQLGLHNVLLYGLGRMSVERARRAVQRLVGDEVFVQLDASPRVSLDLDGPEDYFYIRGNWDRLTEA